MRTPDVLNQRMSAKDGELYENLTQCKSIVGALEYFTFTKLHIICAMNQVSQVIHAPRDTTYMDSVKRMLNDLKGTMKDILIYRKSDDTNNGHQLIILVFQEEVNF